MIRLFDANDFEFADWAKNNMDWDNVKDKAFLVRKGEITDFDESWINGRKYNMDELEIKLQGQEKNDA